MKAMKTKTAAGLGLSALLALFCTSALAQKAPKNVASSAPVVVDASGAVVGAIVPLHDDYTTTDTDLRLAAVYRSGSERVKVLFLTTPEPSNPFNSIATPLSVKGYVLLFETADCAGDAAYFPTYGYPGRLDSEYDGYSPLLVTNRGDGLALVCPDFAVGVFVIDPTVRSELSERGECSNYPMPIPKIIGGSPVVLSALNFTGPFRIQ